MNLYWIHFNRSMQDHVIHDGHRWIMPSVSCDLCGETWATTGLEYPSIDLSGFDWHVEYQRARPVPAVEWFRLRDQLIKALPDDIEIKPGLCMGPSTGLIRGRVRDMAWRYYFACFLYRELYNNLSGAGVRMPKCYKTELQTDEVKLKGELVELEIRPAILMKDDCYDIIKDKCPRCGYMRTKWNGVVRVDESSMTLNCDIFRVSNHPTIILATGRFVDAVKQMGLVSIECHDIEVV